MMRKAVDLAGLAVLLLAGGVAAAQSGGVKVYPAVEGEPVSKMFQVSVQGKGVPVYVAKVMSVGVEKPKLTEIPGVASFASFDMDGPVTVTVTYSELVKTVKVLPVSRGIVPKVAGKTVTFTVLKPDQLVVDVNGDWNNSLQVFADPFETNVPDPNDKNVIYFGPGRHETEPITIGAGKTLYVAGGAIVYEKQTSGRHGSLITLLGDGIKVRGRGIVDGSLVEWHGGNMFRAQGTNISFEGLMMRDSGSFTVRIDQSDHVVVEDVKLIGDRLNGDGIDIINSRNVDVKNSYLRVYDDLVVLKTSSKGAQSEKDITVEHMVLWNERAHPLSLGAEEREDIENVVFRDCDIVHDKGHDWLLGDLHGDAGNARHIVFEDIRIDEDRRPFGIILAKGNWTKDETVGSVEDVVFRNITSVKPEWDHPTQLIGQDAQHMVKGVLFDHVMLGGKPMKRSDISQNAFVTDVVVKP